MLGMEILLTEIQTLEGNAEETRQGLLEIRSQLIDGGSKEDSVLIRSIDILIEKNTKTV